MENVSLQMNDTAKKKSPWEKPGGTLAMIVTGGLVAGGCVLLYKILPWLIVLAQNTLTFALLLGAIALILFLVTNKQVRHLVSTLFFMTMRWLTGLVIEINPIAIVERQIDNMVKKLQNLHEVVGQLRGYNIKAEREISNYKTNIEKNAKEAIVLKENGNEAASIVKANQAKRLNDSLAKQIKNLQASEMWLEKLVKLETMAGYAVEDAVNEVEERKKEYERVKKQHKAFKSAMSLLNNDPDEYAMFNMSMDYMENDITSKLGEMEHFLDGAGGLLSNFDAQTGVARMEAEEFMSKIDELGFDKLFSMYDKNEPASSNTPKLTQGTTNFITPRVFDAQGQEIKQVNKYF